MRLVLVVLALCACGGTKPGAIANRGGTTRTSCELPARIEFDARRYANLDADDKDYQVWSAWRVGLQLADRDTPRGTIAMVGDDLTWTFDFTGKLASCKLELSTATHEPFWITVDLATHTGTVRSIDDEWLLGPPFPVTRR